MMDDSVWKSLKTYIESLPPFLISLSLVVIGFVVWYAEFINEYNIFIFIFAVFGLLHLLFLISSKISDFLGNTYKKYQRDKILITNYELLSKEEKKIIDQIYFKKKLIFQLNTNIKTLQQNGYIVIQQKMADGYICRIKNKKISKFLDQIHKNTMKAYLQNLSDIEKDILNLFYNEEHKDKYDSEDEYALNLLIAKKIIERKDDKQIVISKYAKKLVKYFRGDKIKYNEIELGKHNIFILPDVGAGARGSSY
jgi:hypothetical protein